MLARISRVGKSLSRVPLSRSCRGLVPFPGKGGATSLALTSTNRSLHGRLQQYSTAVTSYNWNLLHSAVPSFFSPSSSSSSSSWLRKLLLMGVGSGLALWFTTKETDACGIVAFVGNEPALQYLMEGLMILQNRGYDSAGVTTISKKSGELTTTKYASKGSTSDSVQLVLNEASEHHSADYVGIAHTRWATHGGKTDLNAHPHQDYKDRIALVHNGTIENADEIKEELMGLGIPFRSETDTEVIAQLIGHYLDAGLPTMEAVKKALSRLEGTWGLAIISKDQPTQIIAARNGSPLVVGVGKDRMFVASEVTAFSRHCTDFVSLNDGEVALVSADTELATLDLSRMEKAPHVSIELSPDPYPHWTIKEIMEQPESVSRCLGYGGRFTSQNRIRLGGLDMNSNILLPIRHLLIGACGTSYFASIYGTELMRYLKSFDTVNAVDASEFNSEALPPSGGGLLVVSQSGETKDVHRALEVAQSEGAPIFSVVNSVGSLIARTTRCGVYLNAGRENAVASTKAFTSQVTAMALVAQWFSEHRMPDVSAQRRQEVTDSLHRLPTYIGMMLRSRPQMKQIAEKLKNKEHLFVLGKGYGYPIALEAALKIKEISYIHAEGYGGGALKHGPFALLDNGTPVILIVLDDQHAELMRIAAAQVRARGAYTIVITDKPKLADGIADDVIHIPHNGPMTALLGIIPLQLLAYELSLMKGIDPDKPRHLAKAVTVD